jgi:hypothetical protein
MKLLEEITNLINSKRIELCQSQNISLHTGSSGALLFLTLYNEVFCNQEAEITVAKLIEHHIDVIKYSKNLQPDFCEGIAGVCWLLTYMKEINCIDYNAKTFFEECDNYLSISLEKLILQDNWDLLYGALGIGFYFLKRKKNAEVRKIIGFLKNKAVFYDKEIAWLRYEEYFSQFVIDTGFAHGNAGIICFLTQCYRNKIAKSTCEELLNGALNFYLKYIQNESIVGSYWKDFIEIQETVSGWRNPKFSKLAWCYGDLNILNALHYASQIIKNKSCETLFLSMMKKVALRRSQDTTLIDEPYTCHGSSGAALVFQSVFERTSEKVFKEAQSYWLDVTEDLFAAKKSSYSNFNLGSSFFADKENLDQISLLSGVSGVGLTILDSKYATTFKRAKFSDWKEAFFLFK